jgi:hypothetical protein
MVIPRFCKAINGKTPDIRRKLEEQLWHTQVSVHRRARVHRFFLDGKQPDVYHPKQACRRQLNARIGAVVLNGQDVKSCIKPSKSKVCLAK